MYDTHIVIPANMILILDYMTIHRKSKRLQYLEHQRYLKYKTIWRDGNTSFKLGTKKRI